MYVRFKLEILKIVNLEFELSSLPFEKKEEKPDEKTIQEDTTDTKSS